MPVNNTHEGPARIGQYLVNASSAYFIGVGGIMMSSLALLTAQAGYPVYGSDREPTPLTEYLQEQGIRVYYEHSDDHIPADCGLVVFTVAISPDNPEYVYAQKHGIPCVSRADYLGYIMTRYKNRVGVSGMHGKSTCTSICAQIFMDADADPTILSGAEYEPMGGAYRIGADEHFIFEACEYMDSFLDFHPTVAVLLGAELEHVDYFKDMEHIRRSFATFASLTGKSGVTVVNADDENSMDSAYRALRAGSTGRIVTFSTKDPAADFYATDISMTDGRPRFTVVAYGEVWGEVQMIVPGRHQVYNALAASAAAHVCGIDRRSILRGLSHFVGASRRMELRGEINGAPLYDDYGHHPTEVRSTLEGAAALCGTHEDGTRGRLLVAFQPHTFSRTARLYDQFMTAFCAADRLVTIDIYPARETDTLGMSSEKLARDLCACGTHATYARSHAEAAAYLRSIATPGDVIVVMGAGNVIWVTDHLLGDE
jgi:UDP-N-acetylmuramate--alanine ligase